MFKSEVFNTIGREALLMAYHKTPVVATQTRPEFNGVFPYGAITLREEDIFLRWIMEEPLSSIAEDYGLSNNGVGYIVTKALRAIRYHL